MTAASCDYRAKRIEGTGLARFFVTSFGEVYSDSGGPRLLGGIVIDVPKLIPQSYAGKRYRRVSLWDGKKTQTRYVHDLVATAFVPGKADGLEVRHFDGNKENNRATNLIWGTPKENGEDAVRLGESTKGTRDAMAKLDDLKIAEIRALLDRGDISQRKIAAMYGVCQPLISMIKTRKLWTHVPDGESK